MITRFGMALSIVCAAIAPMHAAPLTIVVHHGQYPSAEAAARDEDNVRWDDGDDADDIICTESFAAVELQTFLNAINAPHALPTIPVVNDDEVPPAGDLILVGNPRTNRAVARWADALGIEDVAWSELASEGYILKTATVHAPGSSPRRVLLAGGHSRVGTLYAVYDLLDRLGVRWLSPDPVGQVLPDRPVTTLPELDVMEKPAFLTRGFYAWEDRADEAFFDWMARNRLNFWCVQTPRPAALKKRGIRMDSGGHSLQSMFLNPNAPYPYSHPIFEGDEHLPPTPYPVSPYYRGDVNGDGRLRYREAHPEWYALRDGKRSFNIQDVFGDNFCSSNAHANSEFMKNIVAYLVDGGWRHADSINFWTSDIGNWCECGPCEALGTPTDRNLLLVHRLDQEIKRAQAERRLTRDVRIFFLAYADVLEPPTRPLPDDFDYDNCMATYFPIARCYVHPFFDEGCTEFNAAYLEHFTGWAIDPDRHYRGQVCIGEYYNVSGYKCLPAMFARTMAVDIPYYHDHGARHMHYMHVTTKNWGTKALTNVQFARMLWDPHQDVDALLADYFAKRYGPAAETMHQLYDALDTALSNVTMLKYRFRERLNANEKPLFDRKHMPYEPAAGSVVCSTDAGPSLREMVTAIDRCMALAEEVLERDLPEDVRARVREDVGPLTYAANTLHFYDVLVRATLYLDEGRREQARRLVPEMKRLAEALREDTVSTAHASSHANAPNAFDASIAAQAYERLLTELNGSGDDASQ